VRAFVFPGIILFLTACSPVISQTSAGILPTRPGRPAVAISAAPTAATPTYQAQTAGGYSTQDNGGMQKDCQLTDQPDGQSDQLAAPELRYSFEKNGKLLIQSGETTSDPGTAKVKLRSTIPFVATFMFAVCALATPNVLAEAPPDRAVGAD